MNRAIKIGLSFGLSSGVITTLGVLIGIGFGTESKLLLVGSILTIAVSDTFSDALGVHVSEEADLTKTTKDVWFATISAFSAKLFFSLSFLLPLYFFSIFTAILISTVWGLFSLAILSYVIAKYKNESPFLAIGEHLLIAVLVIIATYFIGIWINSQFY